MMLNANLLRGNIQNTLTPLGLYSLDAEELLMATAAQESLLGQYRTQMGGPALGIFQMEPFDFNDIWANYLHYKPIAVPIQALFTANIINVQDIVNNDAAAIAMARVHYLRAPGMLPAATDLAGLWAYYKRVWNTPLGAATQQQFYSNYHNLVQGPAR
jgi:hypothetical protein